MTENFLLPPETLTDLHTKTYSSLVFRHLLEWQSRRAVRYQEAFALLCVALDRSSDRAANRDGETELAIVAENIRKEVRQTDLIGRDGETLIILLLYAGNGETLKIAERVAARIENYAFPGRSRGERVHRTISVGGAHFPLDAVDSSLLMKKGLRYLRRAQKEGGNKVLLSEGS